MIAFDSHRITDPCVLASIVLNAHATDAHQLPAVMAGAAGTLDVTFLTKRVQPPPGHLNRASGAHLVIVADDPATGYGTAGGPTAWQGASKLQYFRPACCFVHASEQGRILMIETSSAQGPAWGRLMQRYCPTVVWLPKNGPHPLPDAVH